MIDYHFIIYGVFEGEKCLMVGSTNQSLKVRRYGYRAYKWFDPAKHEHRILWEGTMQFHDKEQAHYIRAAKETMWIARMDTWWSNGKNQASPLKQVMGGPYAYEDRAAATRVASRAGRARWRKANPEQAFLNSSKAGKLGGPKGGRLGGKRVRELYPNMAEENGHRQGLINAENGHLRLVGDKGRHTRWHVARGKVDPTCVSCVGNISEDLHV